MRREISQNIDNFTGFIDKNKTKKYTILEDNATYGMGFLFQKARENKCLVHLSGQGPDEIFADYGFNGKKFKSHSNFGGKFPQDLKEIFPVAHKAATNSFFLGTYPGLTKEKLKYWQHF